MGILEWLLGAVLQVHGGGMEDSFQCYCFLANCHSCYQFGDHKLEIQWRSKLQQYKLPGF